MICSVTILVVIGIPFPASGCGDKLVMLGRGVRFDQLYTSRAPGNVVLFSAPGSRMEKADRKLHIGASLSLAGHEVKVVRTPEELEAAAHDAAVDLLLVDSERVSGVEVAKGGPELLGILYKPSKEELLHAVESNTCLTEAAPRKGRALLELVDAMIEKRANGETPDCPSPAEK